MQLGEDARDRLDVLILQLEELLLVGNPIYTEAEEPNAIGSDYRLMVLKRVPQLMKLDGIAVDGEEREKAATFEPADDDE